MKNNAESSLPGDRKGEKEYLTRTFRIFRIILAILPILVNDIPKSMRPPLLHADTTEKILGACFEVAAELGSGFLESVYENALAIALRQKGLQVQCQHPITVTFRGENVGVFYADLLVEDKVVVELKAVKALAPENLAQVINYLKATGKDVGLIINFGSSKLEYRRLYREKPEPVTEEF